MNFEKEELIKTVSVLTLNINQIRYITRRIKEDCERNATDCYIDKVAAKYLDNRLQYIIDIIDECEEKYRIIHKEGFR